MKKQVILLIIIVLAILGAAYIYFGGVPKSATTVGGQRDAHGCLGPAGYSYDEEIGACARGWELTPDIKRAAKIAVDYVGQGYALTVISLNSYEDRTYDIVLEKGTERTPVTIHIDANGVARE
jgi:hypothetical protein